LVVCTIRVCKMSYGLNKTQQMCTVKIETGLGYKSFCVQVQQTQVQVLSSPAKMDLSPKSSTSLDNNADTVAHLCIQSANGMNCIVYYDCHVMITLLLSKDCSQQKFCVYLHAVKVAYSFICC